MSIEISAQKDKDIENKVKVNSKEEILHDLTQTLFSDSTGTVRNSGESFDDEYDSEVKVLEEYDSKIVSWICSHRDELSKAIDSSPRVLKIANLFLTSFFPESNFMGLGIDEIHDQTLLQLVAAIIKDITDQGFDALCAKSS